MTAHLIAPAIECVRLWLVEKALNRLQERIARPEFITKTELSQGVSLTWEPLLNLTTRIEGLEERIDILRKALAQNSKFFN
jgi:hypothetical protein